MVMRNGLSGHFGGSAKGVSLERGAGTAQGRAGEMVVRCAASTNSGGSGSQRSAATAPSSKKVPPIFTSDAAFAIPLWLTAGYAATIGGLRGVQERKLKGT